MLARRNRIDKKSFDSVFGRSRVVANNVILLRYCVSADAALSRFSCIVSKKVSKKSPVRHTLKRRVYALCRAHMSTFPAGYFMFFLKKGCETMTFESLQASVTDLIKKIN